MPAAKRPGSKPTPNRNHQCSSHANNDAHTHTPIPTCRLDSCCSAAAREPGTAHERHACMEAAALLLLIADPLYTLGRRCLCHLCCRVLLGPLVPELAEWLLCVWRQVVWWGPVALLHPLSACAHSRCMTQVFATRIPCILVCRPCRMTGRWALEDTQPCCRDASHVWLMLTWQTDPFATRQEAASTAAMADREQPSQEQSMQQTGITPHVDSHSLRVKSDHC